VSATPQLLALNSNGAPGRFSFGSRIIGFEVDHRPTAEYLLPGFIDLQVNGAFGIDVMSASADELREISRRLLAEGTTAWLPTVITASLDRLERVDGIVSEAIEAQAGARQAAHAAGVGFNESAILGLHLEGPFLSPHRLGVHPQLNLLPEEKTVERVMGLKTLRLITLAPELDGALDAIRRFAAQQIAVSIGHTDATYEQAMAGVAAGARMFTHLFNAMPPLHHRAPGAAGAALVNSVAMAALIPDGVHVHPAMLQIAWRARGPGGTIFSSDRVALAGSAQQEGALLGGAVRAAIVDSAVRRSDGALAGSIISMLDAVRNMRRHTNIDVRGVINGSAYNPARVLRLRDRGNLLPGSHADLLLMDREFNLKAVFIDGHEVD
jgi:N-acetylglucosamine-6-phosphate deacetylase